MHDTAPMVKLKEKGLVLPPAAAPVANYVPWVLSGSILTISGQLPFNADGRLEPRWIGKLGRGVSLAQGQEAARQCALNLLAQALAALGDLGRIARVIRLGGFVNCADDYDAIPQVMNGASDLMVDILGEAGRHARYAVGVAQLPAGVAVEVEASLLIKTDEPRS